MGKKYFGNYVQCPHPKCIHVGLMITKVHCRTAHKMEREKLYKKYGEPKPVSFDVVRLRNNTKQPIEY